MAKQISDLSIAMYANYAPVRAAFSSLAATVQNTKSTISSIAGTMLAATPIAAGLAAGMAIVKGTFGSLSDSISLASTLEQNQVAFETMTGSAEKAKDLMAQIGTFAAETPFEFPELASSAKKLLAFGTAADQIVPTMRALGDISSGIGAPLNEIAELFGKAKVQGTLMAEDINQLVGRGIPVIQQFAKQLGVTEGEVKNLASKGKINFAMLQQAVVDMTGEGGQFSGMMAKQSQTLGGLWSTLTDNISMTLAGLVKTIVDAFNLKGAIARLSGFVGTAGAWFQSMVSSIAPTIAGIGNAVWSAAASVFGGITKVVSPIITAVYEFVASRWQSIADTAQTAFAAVYDVVAGVFQSVYNFVAPIVESVHGVLANAWQRSLTISVGLFNSIYNVISSTLSAAWSIVQTVGTSIAAAWSAAMDALGFSSATAAGAVGGAFDQILKAVQWVQAQVTLAFNIAAFAITNFKDIVAAAMLASAYEVVKFGNEVTYLFTDVIPGYLTWFARNWRQIFTDAATMTATVFSNLASNVGNFFAAIWSAMKGEGFNFEWKGLTDGFKTALTELPQIAARQVGPMEQTLGDASAAMNAQLSKGLGQYLADQDAKAKAVADAAKKTVDGIGQSIANAGKPKGITDLAAAANAAANPKGKIEIDNKGANKAIDDTKAKAEGLKAIASGSAEAMQLQAQAQFAALMQTAAVKPAAAPQAQPAPPSPATVAAVKPQDNSADLLAFLTTQVPGFRAVLDKIATSVAKPQTQTAGMV